MVDELAYAGKYGAELAYGFAAGYLTTSQNTDSGIIDEDLREEYDLNTDTNYDLFTMMAENSSKSNEYKKIFSSLIISATSLEGIDQLPELTDKNLFDGRDIAMTSLGVYLGATVKQSGWDDIREALS